jgi:uncharacterized repeat protein (TIGR03833 family)
LFKSQVSLLNLIECIDMPRDLPPVPARHEIHVGQTVWAVEKRNYTSGELTKGAVARILTSVPHHPRGTKVMFQDGTVARVQRITPPEEPSRSPPTLDGINTESTPAEELSSPDQAVQPTEATSAEIDLPLSNGDEDYDLR